MTYTYNTPLFYIKFSWRGVSNQTPPKRLNRFSVRFRSKIGPVSQRIGQYLFFTPLHDNGDLPLNFIFMTRSFKYGNTKIVGSASFIIFILTRNILTTKRKKKIEWFDILN